tara:strand:+ start:1280 stop:1507 length:228 start_codon:yes stop_codon:yes gene_type:complete
MVLIRPHKATHALLTESGTGKKALVVIDDLDTLEGSAGKLQWMRLTRNEREILSSIDFDGTIDEIQSDYRKTKRI